jgi:hypothetical protein
MTEHYSHVELGEKLRTANNIVRLVPGLSKSPTPPSNEGSGWGSKDEEPIEADEAISA